MIVRCGRWLIVLCCLLWLAPNLPAADPKPIDPAEVPLREFLKAQLVFEPFVFSADKFPPVRFEPAQAASNYLGEHTLRTTFYRLGSQDKAEPVTTPDRPGAYGAVVEIATKTGPTVHRYTTLYRTAQTSAADQRFADATLEQLAPLAGIAPAALARQDAKLLAAVLKEKPFSELARSSQFARLLAGLQQTPAGSGPLRKNEDALVYERQAWVTLKRQLLGLDKTFASSVARPRKIAGPAARTVREGTLAEAGMKPDAAEKIDEALQRFAADTDQAFAVCIVRHGVIVLHKAYGTRDGRPMTLHDKSWMASVTKTMSATQMMMLVDQGLVQLDDPVEKYLPALRDVKVERPLTIRHLYTHTNGLEKWPGLSDELADAEYVVADLYPRVKVGQAWGYNGLGYTLGGKIIEAVSGEAMPLFYLHHLLDPLGCDHTDVIATHADAVAAPLDMARFGQMLLNRGSYGEWQFFSPETFEQMLPRKLTITLGAEATKTFGIGLDGVPERFGHGAASAATFHVDTVDDLVIIMTRNKQGTNQDKYNGPFRKAITDGIDRSASAAR